jgi:hypothetical protein
MVPTLIFLWVVSQVYFPGYYFSGQPDEVFLQQFYLAMVSSLLGGSL